MGMIEFFKNHAGAVIIGCEVYLLTSYLLSPLAHL